MLEQNLKGTQYDSLVQEREKCNYIVGKNYWETFERQKRLILLKCNTTAFIQSFWLQIQRSRVRFPALPNFMSSSGSGTGSTQTREVN